MEKESSAGKICREIFCTADILRDHWLASQNADHLRQLGRFTINQHRLIATLLRMTSDRPEGVPLNDLASRLGLTGSSVSIMVDGMVKRDWLVRTQDPVDRRRVMIRVSNSGQEKLTSYRKFFSDLCAPFLSSLPPEELEGFLQKLTALNRYLEKCSRSEK